MDEAAAYTKENKGKNTASVENERKKGAGEVSTDGGPRGLWREQTPQTLARERTAPKIDFLLGTRRAEATLAVNSWIEAQFCKLSRKAMQRSKKFPSPAANFPPNVQISLPLFRDSSSFFRIFEMSAKWPIADARVFLRTFEQNIRISTLPNNNSLISLAAWRPSSFRFFSICLLLAKAALSSADIAQPMIANFSFFFSEMVVLVWPTVAPKNTTGITRRSSEYTPANDCNAQIITYLRWAFGGQALQPSIR